MKFIKAQYRCNDCATEWEDLPGHWATRCPVTKKPYDCPGCGGLYWSWLNYDSDFGDNSATEQLPQPGKASI